ncbi:hypothetical protein F5Y15DRAFT_7198 [Xylariaceae sp. FL0016]|nr:hypothetical protein F5Y15DRAFT_7198 [Xylariaceae sp. FL0016]
MNTLVCCTFFVSAVTWGTRSVPRYYGRKAVVLGILETLISPSTVKSRNRTFDFQATLNPRSRDYPVINGPATTGNRYQLTRKSNPCSIKPMIMKTPLGIEPSAGILMYVCASRHMCVG